MWRGIRGGWRGRSRGGRRLGRDIRGSSGSVVVALVNRNIWLCGFQSWPLWQWTLAWPVEAIFTCATYRCVHVLLGAVFIASYDLMKAAPPIITTSHERCTWCTRRSSSYIQARCHGLGYVKCVAGVNAGTALTLSLEQVREISANGRMTEEKSK